MSRLVFYNAGPPSETAPTSATRDIGGLLREYRPRILVACEVVGDRLAPQPGYAMVRDVSRPGRANVVAFVREDSQLRKAWWIDHKTRWTRTKHPQLGLHPARSTLVLGVGELQALGGHQVPMGTDHTREGQLEIVKALQLVMTPWTRPRIRDAAPELRLEAMKNRPRALLWDDNAPKGSNGLGSSYLGPRIGGHRHGEHIDNLLGRALPVDGQAYVTHAGGVTMDTDHPWGALVVNVARGAVRWNLT